MAEQIAIEVQIDTKTVATSIGVLTQRLEILKAEQKRINDEFKAGQLTAQEYGEQISDVKQQIEQTTRELKSNTAAMQIATTEGLKENATLDEQRQYLNTLQKAYSNLTAEQKQNADGVDVLTDQIKALSDSVKEQEAAIGDTRRNVGNYSEAVTSAFGQLAQAGELMSPAIGLLRGMGAQGKTAAAALDSLQKVLQLVGKAGKVVTASTQAQTAATGAQTTAQMGLNAAMAANPIGLIITGISTLLPLISAFCDDSAEAEQAQKRFNDELARQARLISTIQNDYEFAAKLAEAEGKSYEEVMHIRREGAKKAHDAALRDLEAFEKRWREMSAKERKNAKEHYDNLKQAEKETYDAWNKIIQDDIINQAKQRQKAREDTNKKAKEARDKARQAAIEAYEQARKDAENLRKLDEQLWNDRIQTAIEKGKELLAAMPKEEEDEEYIPTPDEMARNLFGLDDEGVKRFRELLDKGVSFQEAATTAQEEMFDRIAQKRREHDNEIIDQIEKWSNAVMGAVQNITGAMNAAEDAELAKYKQANEAKKKMLDERLKKGLISQAQYDKEVAAMEAAEARKSDEIAIKQAKREKAVGIATATINTALAVARAFADYPWFVALPLSILAAAAGAAQIATIVKTPLPEPQAYATGGIVPGTSYTGDNVPARLNSGEMVLNKESQQRLFDALSGTSNDNSLGFNYDLMAAANAAIPAPVVVYTELQEFGQKVTTYNEIASV